MPTAALIIVNYRSARLAIDAIRSARSATSMPLQVIAVDNSTDDAETAALRSHADLVLASESNIGYAAAINRGRKHADGEFLIVSNPDVIFAPGSIDHLIGAGADVAGPALYWDDAFQWHLPPAELHTAGEVMSRGIASRSQWWRRTRDARRIRSRIAFWSLDEITPARALSGAVLAIRSAAFDRAGGFDERFHLYYEENDFLRRVRDRIMYVPQARCRHLYNQSAGESSAAPAIYEQSEAAYLTKWNGRWVASMLKQLERPVVSTVAHSIDAQPVEVRSPAWVEASPLSSFDTAAGYLVTGQSFTVPAAIWDTYRGDVLYVRVVNPSGHVLATYSRSKIGP